VAPLVAWPAPTGGTPSLPHVAVAALTLAVGYLTKNVLLAMGTGAGSFVLLLYVSG
jgi:hypothetical protein